MLMKSIIRFIRRLIGRGLPKRNLGKAEIKKMENSSVDLPVRVTPSDAYRRRAKKRRHNTRRRRK
jgi:hypothetical protein